MDPELSGQKLKAGNKKLQTFWLLLSAFWMLAYPGCEKSPSEEFAPVLNVHGLLRKGNDTCQIQVDRSYAITESSGQFFSGATVRLWKGNDTWEFCYDTKSNYLSREAVTVQSRDTFYLQVSAPGFETVWARTVVPDTFSITKPVGGDTVSVDSLLCWTRSRNCGGYLLAVGDTSGTWFIGALPDSLAGRLPMFFLAGAPGEQYTLHLLALDTNYYNWMIMAAADTVGVRQNRVSGLVGGMGVFGSAVECSVRVFVKQPVRVSEGYSLSRQSNR
ncbi:MAG: DUF4249 family protein [candidate division WOR-3 bacterium]